MKSEQVERRSFFGMLTALFAGAFGVVALNPSAGWCEMRMSLADGKARKTAEQIRSIQKLLDVTYRRFGTVRVNLVPSIANGRLWVKAECIGGTHSPPTGPINEWLIVSNRFNEQTDASEFSLFVTVLQRMIDATYDYHGVVPIKLDVSDANIVNKKVLVVISSPPPMKAMS